jgi:protein-arginine kinase activator protein McsA
MKCDQCDRPATVHPTTVVAGKWVAAHLCESCAGRLDA